MTRLPRDLYRHYRKRAKELAAGSLERSRKRAENWRTGLAGLTALVAIIGTVSGPSYFRGASTGLQISGAVAVAIAFVCLLTGTLLAMSAAFGEPTNHWLLPDEIHRYEQQELGRIRDRLILARAGFIVGVLASAYAASIPFITAWNPPDSLQSSLVWIAGEGGGQVVSEVKAERIPEGAQVHVTVTGVAQDSENSDVVLAERMSTVGLDRTINITITATPQRRYTSYKLDTSITSDELDEPITAQRVVNTSVEDPSDPALSLQWIAGDGGGEVSMALMAGRLPAGTEATIALRGIAWQEDTLLLNHAELVGESGALDLTRVLSLTSNFKTLVLEVTLRKSDVVLFDDSIQLMVKADAP